MLNKRLMRVQVVLALGAILIASCGAGAPEATPTYSVDQIQTYAVATFSSALTLTAIAAPPNTPAATLTPAPTFAPLATSTGGIPLGAGTTPGGVAPTTSCYGLTFVSDVSIPDNTQMTAGKSFTKTWKVQNSGSCAWDAGFKFQNTGGDAMGASAFTLPASVASGATYDISVPMTAPSTPGTLRGNWRMSTASGQFFGDEVYVQIITGGGAAATNTSAPAASTATSTTP
jgi:Ig-like domain from next to BRCA1 gene